MTSFREVAAGVYVLRYPVLDVNVALVVGDGAALLVDTLATAGQARELRAAIREVTSAPWTVVNTHHHFDHCFGNEVLAPDPATAVWAHAATAHRLMDAAATLPEETRAAWQASHPELAAGAAATRLRPPDRHVRGEVTLAVGGRPVVLWHPGRGHTDGDLVVEVPDAHVLIAGDLVEQGAPPDFEDAYPLAWPAALAALIARCDERTVVVPGHGAPVDRAFVVAQHATLRSLARLIRDGFAVAAPPEQVARGAPLPFGPARTAVARGYAELAAVA